MTHGGSGTFTVYNADQKKVIKTLEQKGKTEDDAVYLFFVENVQGRDMDGDFAGYMPQQYQYGFIYGNPNATTVAHELAHGAFSLAHTFSNEQFIAAKSTTDNLLDYKGGEELWAHQWKLVHNPKNGWLKFLQDEEEGEGIFKPDLSGIFYKDSLLLNNQTLYFVPSMAESVTFFAKKKEEQSLDVNWKIGERSLKGDSVSFTIDEQFFNTKEQIKIEARDKVIFGKDSLINVYIEKVNIDTESIIDSLMLSLKNIKQNLDSLQQKLPEYIEDNMDALSIMEDKYISKGMSKEFEAPPVASEKEIEKILLQIYLLDQIIMDMDSFDEYVTEIIKLYADPEKRNVFIQSIRQSMTALNPFTDRETLEKQYREMVIQNFYQQLNILIQK
jgi:hypothetical protein